jgi:kynurenine formamidase
MQTQSEDRNSELTLRWGRDDELGALNEITPAIVVKAAGLVKKGKVYRLGRVLEYGIPQHWFHGEFQYSTFRRHGDTLKLFNSKNRMSAMNMKLSMADHTGTHIDGLNHISIGGKLYGGLNADAVTQTFGTTNLGIEKTPPIFTRGVFIDIASLKKKESLEPGYVITSRDIEDYLGQTSLSVQPGDAILIRTGWGRYWMKDNEKYLGPCPGIGKDAARLLIQKRVAIIGLDTYNVEVSPNEDPQEEDSVHQMLIVENGIRLIENLSLEEAGGDQIKECLFVCLPLMVKGGSGSPISPIAVT